MSMLSLKLESVLLPLVYENADLQKIINAAAEFLGTPIRFSPENNPDYAFILSSLLYFTSTTLVCHASAAVAALG